MRCNPWDARISQINQLGICILLDVIGLASYFLPVLGEGFDIPYAPIYAFCVYQMVGAENWGLLWTGVAFAEEILPFTDILPSATIGWALKQVI